MSDGADVLRAIDQLRRDLSGYHGQLVAHNDLQRHCERQKEQLAALQAAHKPIKDERDLYKRQADRLAAENAKLREQLAKARDPQRIGGTADPESFVYAIEQLREFRWQHATNDEEAIPYINNVADAHERENAKLREQGERLFDKTLELGTENEKLREFARTACKIADSLCELAPSCAKCACPDTTDGRCVLTQIERSLYELGVEV